MGWGDEIQKDPDWSPTGGREPITPIPQYDPPARTSTPRYNPPARAPIPQYVPPASSSMIGGCAMVSLVMLANRDDSGLHQGLGGVCRIILGVCMWLSHSRIHCRFLEWWCQEERLPSLFIANCVDILRLWIGCGFAIWADLNAAKIEHH